MFLNSPLMSFAIIFLTFCLYAIVHSLLASLKAKALAAALFGETAVARYYRLFFNGFGTVSLLPILILVPLLPDQTMYQLALPWSAFMLVGQGVGALVLLVALIQTGPFAFLGLSQPFVGNQNRETILHTEGLYAWVRHPLYTGGLLILWLSTMMSVNIFAFNLGISVYFLVGAYFEERKLLRIFGQDYQDYKQKTPMFIPWVGWK